MSRPRRRASLAGPGRTVHACRRTCGLHDGPSLRPAWTEEVVMARNDARVTGWWVFAAALLLLAGFLNYELAKAPESSTTA